MNVAWNFWSEHLPNHRNLPQYSPPSQPSPSPTPIPSPIPSLPVARPPSPQQDIQFHPISVRMFQKNIESLCGKILEITDEISGLDDVDEFIRKVLTRNLKQRRFYTKRRPLRYSDYDEAMIHVRSKLKELLTYLKTYHNDMQNYMTHYVRKKLPSLKLLKDLPKEPEPKPQLDGDILDSLMRDIDEGCLAMAVLEGQTSSRRFRNSFSRKKNMDHYKELKNPHKKTKKHRKFKL
jgi:hypothetical protein